MRRARPLFPLQQAMCHNTSAKLSPRAIWIRVSRETKLSHSGGLWGLAPQWRHVGCQQARPGPPGSATSEPWDLTKSRQPLSLSVPIQRVGVMLPPALATPGLMIPPRARQLLLSQSRHLPRACPLGHRGLPAASWPAGEEQVLGACGRVGAGLGPGSWQSGGPTP